MTKKKNKYRVKKNPVDKEDKSRKEKTCSDKYQQNLENDEDKNLEKEQEKNIEKEQEKNLEKDLDKSTLKNKEKSVSKKQLKPELKNLEKIENKNNEKSEIKNFEKVEIKNQEKSEIKKQEKIKNKTLPTKNLTKIENLKIDDNPKIYTLLSNKQKTYPPEPRCVTNLPTEAALERKKRRIPSYCQIILMPMFAAMSKITDNLFLTSIGGMTQDNFDKYKISCVINATLEAPNLKKKGIESIRVPVDDSPNDDIQEFFDQVADKINERTLEKINVVVHCVAGVSRSTSLVLAYLMKYHKMDLHEAYNYTHARRPVVRPNNGFFKQLLDYEKKLTNKNSFKMMQLQVNGVSIEVPDFFQNEHKGFIVLESLKEKSKIESKIKNKEKSSNKDSSVKSQIKEANQNVDQTETKDDQTLNYDNYQTCKSIEKLDKSKKNLSPNDADVNEEKRKEILLKSFVVGCDDLKNNKNDDITKIDTDKSKKSTKKK